MYYYYKYVKNVCACVEERVECEGVCMKCEELVCKHDFRRVRWTQRHVCWTRRHVHGTRRHVHGTQRRVHETRRCVHETRRRVPWTQRCVRWTLKLNAHMLTLERACAEASDMRMLNPWMRLGHVYSNVCVGWTHKHVHARWMLERASWGCVGVESMWMSRACGYWGCGRRRGRCCVEGAWSRMHALLCPSGKLDFP